MFEAVYAGWIDLPEDSRPKLVVFGESLGSFGGQDAFAGRQDMISPYGRRAVVGDAEFHAAVEEVTADREPGSLELSR